VLERVAVLFADGRPPSRLDEEDLRAVMPELLDRHAAAAEAPSATVLPPPHEPGEDLRAARRAQERAHVERVIAECGGNQAEAARRLGIGRTTLYRKLGRAH